VPRPTPTSRRKPPRCCIPWPATTPSSTANKRLALAATIAFLGVNCRRLTLSNDQAYNLVMAVAAGELDDVPAIAEHIPNGTELR
jgi:hypothetical protein